MTHPVDAISRHAVGTHPLQAVASQHRRRKVKPEERAKLATRQALVAFRKRTRVSIPGFTDIHWLECLKEAEFTRGARLTPSARKLWNDLLVLQDALRMAFAKEDHAEMWMSAPLPVLDNMTPATYFVRYRDRRAAVLTLLARGMRGMAAHTARPRPNRQYVVK